MISNKIITKRENSIIEKKLKGLSLTQNESNILSKSIRPKLREIKEINASLLLDRLDYNQKAKSIEKNITKLILKKIKEIKAIIVYGSAVQTNYKKYNDIDIIILTNKKLWEINKDKYNIIIDLEDSARKLDLILDVQLMDVHSFKKEFANSPSLIYQLKDSKTIYGKINLAKNKELTKLDLRMKLDWSDIDDEDSKGKEIYQALRNVLLIRLLSNKIVDNSLLRENTCKELGSNIIEKLKSDNITKKEKKLILDYIKELSEKTDKEIINAKWEKIVL